MLSWKRFNIKSFRNIWSLNFYIIQKCNLSLFFIIINSKLYILTKINHISFSYVNIFEFFGFSRLNKFISCNDDNQSLNAWILLKISCLNPFYYFCKLTFFVINDVPWILIIIKTNWSIQQLFKSKLWYFFKFKYIFLWNSNIWTLTIHFIKLYKYYI
jgi:hypothetical protein